MMKRFWKRSVRKLSAEFEKRAAGLGLEIQVGLVKRVTVEDLQSGAYDHLGLSLQDRQLQIEHQVVQPQASMGTWAKRNVEGWTQRHRNLPMESYTIEYDISHFGDWSRTYTVSFERKRYPRTLHTPKLISIKIDQLAHDINGDAYLVRFLADRSIRVGSRDWLQKLFFHANFFQESVGGFEVYSSAASVEDFLSTVSVAWQIFPAGESHSVIRIVGARANFTDQERERLQYRIDVLSRLNPKSFVVGTDGFQQYIGAIIRDDVVVFENAEYGNAIYVMNHQWESLTKMSRIDLMSLADSRVVRIVHTPGWEQRLFQEINRRLAS